MGNIAERLGSTKNIRPNRPGFLTFEITNNFSVFDVGKHPQQIPGKAEALCKASLRSFEIARLCGIKTHFDRQISATEFSVHECLVPNAPMLSGMAIGRVLPCECIWRDRVFGSLYRDFVSGKRDPKEYGLTAKDVEKPGAKLPKLLIEYTTKFERIDRPLTREEARGLMELTKSKLDELESILKRAVYASNSIYELAGYISADGKLEFALCFDNTLMIVDYFGNPDENRLVKISKNGRVMHFSKEFLRQYLIEIGFKKLVDEARALGAPDPAYPDVPDAIVKEASRRYTTVANAYTRIPA